MSVMVIFKNRADECGPYAYDADMAMLLATDDNFVMAYDINTGEVVLDARDYVWVY